MSDAQAANLIDHLTYSSYVSNRKNDPTITPERWATIYGKSTAAMEAKYQRELQAQQN